MLLRLMILLRLVVRLCWLIGLRVLAGSHFRVVCTGCHFRGIVLRVHCTLAINTFTDVREPDATSS